MKCVLFPGSFDPFTNGHLDLAERAAGLFDRVIIAVAVNCGKNPLFSPDERKQIIRDCCSHLANVEVVAFDGLLADAFQKCGAEALLRGLRTGADFEYELPMAHANRNLCSQCETIFMVPKAENSFVSSHLVRELAAFGGDFRRYVPAPAVPYIEEKLRRK